VHSSSFKSLLRPNNQRVGPTLIPTPPAAPPLPFILSLPCSGSTRGGAGSPGRPCPCSGDSARTGAAHLGRSARTGPAHLGPMEAGEEPAEQVDANRGGCGGLGGVAEVAETRPSSMAASLRGSVGRLARTDAGLALPLPPQQPRRSRGGGEVQRVRASGGGEGARARRCSRRLGLGGHGGSSSGGGPWRWKTPELATVAPVDAGRPAPLPPVHARRRSRPRGARPRRRMRAAELTGDGVVTTTSHGAPRASPPMFLVLRPRLLLVLRPLQWRPRAPPPYQHRCPCPSSPPPPAGDGGGGQAVAGGSRADEARPSSRVRWSSPSGRGGAGRVEGLAAAGRRRRSRRAPLLSPFRLPARTNCQRVGPHRVSRSSYLGSLWIQRKRGTTRFCRRPSSPPLRRMFRQKSMASGWRGFPGHQCG
jgi:hypothetical protein